jgi:hypothetical protein
MAGKLVNRTIKWQISAMDILPGEFQLTFEEAIEIQDGIIIKEMRIDLPESKVNKPGKKMIWRVVPGKSNQVEKRITLSSIN